MRRVIALMLSIAMVASLATGLAITGFAEDATFEYEGLMYKVLDEAEKTVEVTENRGKYTATSYVIPATVTSGTDTYNVTAIGESAFDNGRSNANGAYNKLNSVTIPDSVTSIGEKAFYQCEGLTSITIPNGVTSIGSNAFYGCSGLTNVEIPNNVITISDYAFQNCNGLKSITIGKNVASIGSNAFNGCSTLTSINVNNGNTKFTSTDGILYSKENELIRYPAGKISTSFEIPSSVTSIGNYAFFKCTKLTSVTIPASVESIGKNAFSGCTGLTSVTVKATTPPTLSDNAFNSCNSLAKIHVPAGKKAAYDSAWPAYENKIEEIKTSGITINNKPIEDCYGEYGIGTITTSSDYSTIEVDKITTNTNNFNVTIYIPSGKTLIVSNTDSYAISVGSGNLTITGGGEIDVYAFGTNSPVHTAIYAAIGNINITDECTVKAIYEGENDACAAISALSGDINITNESTVIATHKGDINVVDKGLPTAAILTFGGDINITEESTVIATHEGDNNIEGIAAAICSIGKVNISGNSIVIANTSGTDLYGIYAGNDITISGGSVYAEAAEVAIKADSYIKLSANANIEAKGEYAFGGDSYGIEVDSTPIDDKNYTDYFYGKNGQAIFITDDGCYITSTDWVCFGMVPDPEDGGESDIEESDPEVELDLGNGPVTLKTSNNSVVFNDTKYFEFEVMQSNNLFVPVDLSAATQKIDGLFFNNDVYKYISGAGKGIELKTRFAKADVFKKDDIGQNPVSLHLSDVSEIAGTCATAIQKKAMQTSNIYAEVNYSFVTNGKPTDNSAKIYVPVPAEAKVFYLFDEGKIGIVPCEYKDGYCIFDRYFDGTYVVCATK